MTEGSEAPQRRWPAVRSVRFRITAVATVVVALVLIAASVGLVQAQRRSLTSSLEETLAREADAIVIAAEQGDLTPSLDPAGDDDTVAQVVEIGSGDPVLAATANVAGRPAVVDRTTVGPATETVRSVLEEGDRFLFAVRTYIAPTDALVVVSVGAPLDDVHDAVGSLTRGLAVGIPLVVVVLAALVWWLVGRTLRPVEAIRAGASEIGGSDLHRRVPTPSGDDEVARLARTMNAMLDRIEASSDRQQRFVADASHELRSPLTRIRTELEVDMAHPAGADPDATRRSVLDEVDGLQRLVDDLLLLARIDGGVAPLATGDVVDLADVVAVEADRAEAAGGGTVRLARSTARAAVPGDRRALARAVRNVLENATRHATADVTLNLVAEDDHALLRIADDGPGIPDERADDVFERFTRLDDARSAADGGTGLGLAIAKEIVERHGGTIAVDRFHHPGACLVITLPLAED